jgi:hypothetical protein
MRPGGTLNCIHASIHCIERIEGCSHCLSPQVPTEKCSTELLANRIATVSVTITFTCSTRLKLTLNDHRIPNEAMNGLGFSSLILRLYLTFTTESALLIVSSSPSLVLGLSSSLSYTSGTTHISVLTPGTTHIPVLTPGTTHISVPNLETSPSPRSLTETLVYGHIFLTFP